MAAISTPEDAPAFTIPSGATVSVSIIDTTTKLTNIPWSFLSKPPIKGHDYSKDLPALSIFIEHSSDLGTRKDFMQIDAPISARVKKLGWDPSAEKNVIEILEENNIPGQSIEALIWRCTFPQSDGHITNRQTVTGTGTMSVILPPSPVRQS